MKQLAHLSRAQCLLLLNRIPFFKEFTPKEREHIIDQKTSFISAQASEFIIEEGTLDTAFYILLTGSAKVTPNVGETLSHLGPGDFFGEFSFLENSPRSSNVIATDASIMLKVDRRLLGALSAEIREKIKDQIIHKLVTIISNQQNPSIDAAFDLSSPKDLKY